jgi:hypothetical protein
MMNHLDQYSYKHISPFLLFHHLLLFVYYPYHPVFSPDPKYLMDQMVIFFKECPFFYQILKHQMEYHHLHPHHLIPFAMMAEVFVTLLVMDLWVVSQDYPNTLD